MFSFNIDAKVQNYFDIINIYYLCKLKYTVQNIITKNKNRCPQ